MLREPAWIFARPICLGPRPCAGKVERWISYTVSLHAAIFDGPEPEYWEALFYGRASSLRAVMYLQENVLHSRVQSC